MSKQSSEPAPGQSNEADPTIEPWTLERTGRFLTTIYASNASVQAPEYLKWLYGENPKGPVVALDAVSDRQTVGHYAVIPQSYVTPQGNLKTYLSLNTAVDPAWRRRGLFSSLAHAVYDRLADADAVVGVPNASSAPGFISKLDWTLHGALPVHVLFPIGRRRGVESMPVTTELLDSKDFGDLFHQVVEAPARLWPHQRWTLELLRWRLSKPKRSYTIHLSDDLLCIATMGRQGKRMMPIVLKTWVRPSVADRRVGLGQIASAVSGYYRKSVVIYVGHNPGLTRKGPQLPAALRPAPLYLGQRPIRRNLLPVDETKPTVHFEFLDFDVF